MWTLSPNKDDNNRNSIDIFCTYNDECKTCGPCVVMGVAHGGQSEVLLLHVLTRPDDGQLFPVDVSSWLLGL